MDNQQIRQVSLIMDNFRNELLLCQGSNTPIIKKDDMEKLEKYNEHLRKMAEEYRLNNPPCPYEEFAESIAYFKHMVFIHLIEPWALPTVKWINWLIKKVTK